MNLEESNFTSTLRAVGLRSTLVRLRVLEVLTEPQKWMDATAVYNELAARGEVFSLTYVFRTVRELESLGVLLRGWRGAASGGRAVYRISPPTPQEREDAITCRHCGKVSRIVDPESKKQLEQLILTQGFALDAQLIMVQTICWDCSKETCRD